MSEKGDQEQDQQVTNTEQENQQESNADPSQQQQEEEGKQNEQNENENQQNQEGEQLEKQENQENQEGEQQENQENPQEEQENQEQQKEEGQEQQQQQEQESQEQEVQEEQPKKKQEEKKKSKDKKKKKEEEAEEEEKKEEEEVEEKQKELPEDFFYEEEHQENEIPEGPIPSKIVEFHESFGFDSNKKFNLHILDMDTMIYAGGVNYYIVNIIDGNTQIFFSRDGGGIGAIAVHPSRKYFAVAEKGSHPNIYVYEYPSLKLYRILRKGTEFSYSSCCFSHSGDILASVGSSPDYTISLWNWKQEYIILKSKAFSQEVYNVGFSQYSENILTTCGLAHVKFWKVAETFTGLKLKGEIAKFGQVELSDVVAFYIYPDGKVLSSTEYGKMLLWEGNLIKCVISMSIDKEGKVTDCHDGEINVIFRKDNDIVTAGKDGKIRFWDANAIDQAEGDDFSQFYIKPNHEIQLFTEEDVPSNISHITLFDNYWLVSDQRGKIMKLEISESKQEHEVRTLKETNSGKLFDVALSPISNSSVTIGEDGAVRLWDYVNQRQYFFRQFIGKGTCIEWLPYNKKNQGRVLLAGFSTGIVRWLLLNQNGFHLLKAVKVHSSPIQMIQASPDGQNLAILGESGDLFLIEQSSTDLQTLTPYCLYETGLPIRDMQWDRMGEKLLFACDNGHIYETTVLKKEECDNSDTYLKDFEYKSWKMKMMEFQKPKTEEMDLTFLLKHKNDEKKEFEEWEPAPIMNATYFNASCDKVLISVEGQYLGWYYLVDWKESRPIEAFPAPKVLTKYMRFQNYEDYLLIGLENGSWHMRHFFDLKLYTSIASHDFDYGKVFKVVMNYDKTAILSVGGDGFQYCYKFDQKSLVNIVKGDVIENFSYPELANGITEATFVEEISLADRDEEDILDSNIYSIQEAKKLAEEDFRKNEAEKKKQKVLKQVTQLVDRYEKLKQKNMEIDEVARLDHEEMTIDQEYNEMLEKRVQEDLKETQMEVKWEERYYELLTDKIKAYMKDELEVDTFSVKGIKNPKLLVKTFKLKKQSQYLQQNLALIKKEMEENQRQEEMEKENALKEQKNAQGTAENPNPAKEAYKEDMGEEAKELMLLEEKNLTGAKLERLKHKREEARIMRELEELERKRGQEESSEPDHIREIDEAKRNLGDYKLKSDTDYEVQEHQLKNVKKQRSYMFFLQDYIYSEKQSFNKELIKLKSQKKQLIQKIRDYNVKIRDINGQLNIQEELFQPEIDEQLEEPENFFEIKEDEIQTWAAAKYPDKVKLQEKKKADDKNKKKQAEIPVADLKPRRGQKVQHSEIEDQMKFITEMILTVEKKRMLAEINEEIQEFDKKVAINMEERNKIEANIIISQMKLVTYYQELILLLDMEDHDNYLIQNLRKCKDEKQALKNDSDKIVKEQNELTAKDAENEKEYAEKMKEFKELVHPDDDHKREKLHQYWYKKHKKLQARKMKHADIDDLDDDSEGDDMDSEEDDDDEDFMDDDDDERVDLSPIEQDNGTNKALLDKICELEDNQENFRKEKMEKERLKGQIANKLQNILKDLSKAQNELKDYQRKKLGKVNQLDVSFCLKLSQIQNLEPKEHGNEQIFLLPQKLESSILFTQNEFKRLSKRIKELEEEKKKIDKERRRLEITKKKRTIEINQKNEKFNELNKKYEEKHILKFGDLIDLKVLDALQPTKQVLEMREKFKQEEREAIKRVEKAKQSLLIKKQQLLEARRENTKIIKRITKLGEDQMKLNKKLDSSSKQLFKEENEEKKHKSDLEKEKQNLNDLVKFLSKEIDDLRTEISLFKRKGGHIYTMVTSNKKNLA